MTQARIFDVKHYAVHDGPGIRTTFFLMGCPLRCFWCQNPESQKDELVVTFSPTKCIGCGKCVQVCDKLDQNLQLPRSLCNLCGNCVRACHAGAKAFGSRLWTPEDVVAAVLPEKVFFEQSGGGVTFSGGECLTHHVFLRESLRLLKDEGIHTAVDTCGAVPFSAFQDVLPYTDLFLYDIKKIDSASHQIYTGVDNRVILNNLQQLCQSGAHIIVRIPLIPGYTDLPEDMHAVGAYIKNTLKNQIIRCELLPYNKLAESKYGNKTIWNDYTLGDYSLGDLEPQSKQELLEKKEILEQYCVSVYTEFL